VTDQPPTTAAQQDDRSPLRGQGSADSSEQKRQITRAIEWLGLHWKAPQTCPICGSNSWNIGNVYELRPFNRGVLSLSAPIFPVFPVTCTVCGYTMFFNAIIAEILESNIQSEISRPSEELG
jgi:predicted nucleic-acid-binding Zn-ribbon protein